MTGLPRQSVWIAAAVIAALGAFGAYQGVQRSTAPGADDQADGVGAAMPTTPTSPGGAKAATALPEPPPPTVAALSEAQIRSIVRQEVEAALTRETEPDPAEPLVLAPPRAVVAPPPVVRAPDARSDAELFSGAGGGQ